jgi:hypothetical protein
MIISPDRTKVFLAITKNGSTTVEYLLSQIPGVIVLDDMRVKHGGKADLQTETEINPLVAGLDVWNLTYYAFIRNPLDRWFSACNYLKRFPYALINLFPEKFSLENWGVPTVEPGKRWTLDEWTSLTLRQRLEIRGLSPEDFLNIPLKKLGFVVRPQWTWFETGGVEGLRYDDFQNETRKLIGLFGGDTTVNIPTLNAADDFPTATTYTRTQDLYMAMIGRYEKDYRLLEQYGMDH